MVLLKSYFSSVVEVFQCHLEEQLLLTVTCRGLFLFKTHLCASSVLQLQKDFGSTLRRAPSQCFGDSPGWLQGGTETKGHITQSTALAVIRSGCVLMCSHLQCEGTPLPTAAGFISLCARVWYQPATLWMRSTRCLWAPWLCSSFQNLLSYLPASLPLPPQFLLHFLFRQQYRIGLLFISITFPRCDWICGN